MNPIELTPAWFAQCPRYLTAKRFGAMTGFTDQQEQIENLLKQGLLPARKVGRHLMVDMHQLMLMIPSPPSNDEFDD
ncbi:MAG: hypothetical protein AAGC84_16195 [Pseudomonas sp.]